MSCSRCSQYTIFTSLLLAVGCSDTSPTGTEALAGVPIDESPTGVAADSRMRVLVDASKDGGVWWFPQAGSFDPGEGHQGKALADHLRRLGYEVTELGRDERMTKTLAREHQIIIRANRFGPPYTELELDAYRAFLSRENTLILLSDHQTNTDGRDELADLVGIGFVGASAIEPIVTFADHEITDDVEGLPYIAGAYAVSRGTTAVEFLGWLADGQPVMGVVTGLPAKVFFLGDTNGLEGVPQPLVENLIAWGF